MATADGRQASAAGPAARGGVGAAQKLSSGITRDSENRHHAAGGALTAAPGTGDPLPAATDRLPAAVAGLAVAAGDGGPKKLSSAIGGRRENADSAAPAAATAAGLSGQAAAVAGTSADASGGAHQSAAAPSRPKKAGKAGKSASAGPRPTTFVERRDKAIQETNGSSIVSKRSVERLYYGGAGDRQEFFRAFVRKPQRRAPLINRGYWLRMEAVHSAVRSFLAGPGARKIVVNLGCGYDPIPFQYLAKPTTDRASAVFVDVDYPELMRHKVRAIAAAPDITAVLGPSSAGAGPVLLQTANYYAVACNLTDTADLRAVLDRAGLTDPANTFLFVAEVSLTYMDTAAANSVVAWASTLPNASFALLEQILPDGPERPFARTMLSHFNKLSTPIKSVTTYQTLAAQEARFRSLGWTDAHARDLYDFWATDVAEIDKRYVGQVEDFDEWEEFVLFGQHYVFLMARNTGGAAAPAPAPVPAPAATTTLVATPVADARTPVLRRRFAAAAAVGTDFAVSAGLGATTRLGSTALVARAPNHTLKPAGSPPPRMCHSLTALPGGRLLLAGGRTSPGRPAADCAVYDDGWRLAAPLPGSRFRHGAAALPDGRVVVFGGTKAAGEPAWLLYTPETDAWTPLECAAELGERASPTFAWAGDRGVLLGGFDPFGGLYTDAYTWTIDGTSVVLDIQPAPPRTAARGGAQAVPWGPRSVLVAGGVAAGGLLTAAETFVLLDVHSGVAQPVSVTQDGVDLGTVVGGPLLVGFSMAVADDQILLAGGGAVCFSFGAYWNSSVTLAAGLRPALTASEPRAQTARPIASVRPAEPAPSAHTAAVKEWPAGSAVDWTAVTKSTEPIVVRGVDIGPCSSVWTADYLAAKAGDLRVSVHVANDRSMNFLDKNFRYETQAFGDFVDAVFNTPGSQLYLRSLSTDNPKSKVATFREDFPGLAADFCLPAELQAYVDRSLHSSPLRVSSPGVGMWLHYDALDNFLVQVVGTKRVRFYPPSDVSRLCFPPGASSSLIVDVFHEACDLPGTHPHETVVAPGDVLFIPEMWLHAMVSLEPSVSINTFHYAHDPRQYGPGRDLYGNRDLKPYRDGRELVRKIVDGADTLRPAARQFYLLRLADELRQAAEGE
ncbi:uncharacterized protein V1510DRAFT_364432 [Dipodascopsis tothii]|uniref:uncharacterized protein n=1 Tax=Dipodascopsis tothii TaxID=44089 RepID=UPI0034CD1934